MPKCVLIDIIIRIIGWTQNVHYGKHTYSTINGDNFQYAFRYFITHRMFAQTQYMLFSVSSPLWTQP